jgi:DNA polymerase-1
MHIYLRQAMFRGEFMCVNARNECRGIPFDPIFHLVVEHWDRIREQLVVNINADYHVYEGDEFREHLFEQYLERERLTWPRLESGRLDLKEKTFRSMAKVDVRVAPLHELRATLSQLREIKLKVDADGRVRTKLWAFGSKTGRTQPSATEYPFGPATWTRFFIKPRPGRAIAYCDFEQQEFGIAACKSGDENMLAAYASGDPYLAFAEQARALTEAEVEAYQVYKQDADKKSAESERAEQVRGPYKQTSLAVLYGMGEQSLAVRLGLPRLNAQALRRAHRRTYGQFWNWSDAVVAQAAHDGYIRTAGGWWMYVGKKVPVRTLRNFPMQAHGSDILRVACVLLDRYGIEVIATVHDAVLIEADIGNIDQAVALTKAAMQAASRIVLDGFELRVEAKVVRYPNRYTDKRGTRMWETVNALLSDILQERRA